MSPPSRAAATVHAAAAGVSAHFTWQLLSRVASFLLRALVVRSLGPERVAETELNVALVVSLLLLPVAGFRKVSLRVASHAHAAALCALCAAATSLCAVLAGGALALWHPRNAPALAVVAAAVCVRAAAEPHVIFSSRRERYAHHSRARAVCVLVSGCVTAVAVRAARSPAHAAPATALGHLAYSLCMLLAMRVACGPLPVPFPALRGMPAYLRVDDLHMAAATTVQCLFKFVLGHGESVVLSRVRPKVEQGAYFLAGNFASIVARFFNESLEDQCFNVFSRLAPAFRKKEQRQAEGGGSNEDLCAFTEEEICDARATCIHTMHLALKAALLVAVLFAFIGPAYAYSAVRVLYDVEWSENSPAARLLSQYFLYLLFMAANGVTEAFFLSAAVREDIRMHTTFSGFVSVGYMILLYVAAKMHGASGVIAVNCLNMAVRTIFSTAFYCRLTAQKPMQLVTGAIPHRLVFVALGFARYVSLYSEEWIIGRRAGVFKHSIAFSLHRVALHAISGVFAVSLFFVTLMLCERQFLFDMKNVILRRATPVPSVKKTDPKSEKDHSHAD